MCGSLTMCLPYVLGVAQLHQLDPPVTLYQTSTYKVWINVFDY